MGDPTMLDAPPLLRAVNLHKTYVKHANKIQVLRGLDLDVQEGEFLSVIGNSGSGKSTMLHLLGTLDKPDDGCIHLEGRRIDNLSAEERDQMRNRTFGFIFQFYHLLPELNTLENVLMPSMVGRSILGWLRERRELKRRAAPPPPPGAPRRPPTPPPPPPSAGGAQPPTTTPAPPR